MVTPNDDLPLVLNDPAPRELPEPSAVPAALPEVIEEAAPGSVNWLPILERGLNLAERFIDALGEGRAARARQQQPAQSVPNVISAYPGNPMVKGVLGSGEPEYQQQPPPRPVPQSYSAPDYATPAATGQPGGALPEGAAVVVLTPDIVKACITDALDKVAMLPDMPLSEAIPMARENMDFLADTIIEAFTG